MCDCEIERIAELIQRKEEEIAALKELANATHPNAVKMLEIYREKIRELKAAVEAAQARIKELEEAPLNLKGLSDSKKQLEAMREGLRKYAVHVPLCGATEGKCTCGLARLLGEK